MNDMDLTRGAIDLAIPDESRHMWRLGMFLCAMFMLPLSGGAAAQPIRADAKHTITCAKCRIELTKVTTFGSASDSVLLSPVYETVAMDSKRRLFVATFDRRQVAVFSPQGRLTDLLGRAGEGPGEFGASIRRVAIGPGDSIYVFHLRHMTVFTPRLAYVRQATMPMAGADVVLNNGRIVADGLARTAGGVGHPYHVISPHGQIEKSFGYGGQPIRTGEPSPPSPTLRLSSDRKSLWSTAGDNTYHLIHWGGDGRLLDSIRVVDVPWLKESIPDLPTLMNRGWDGKATPTPFPKPGFVIDLAGADSSGLLWITIRKPIGYDDRTKRYLFSNRVEVFDPVNRTILATRSIDHNLWVLDGSNYAISSAPDEVGVVAYTIWRLQLRR